jgi:hypothetical protein
MATHRRRSTKGTRSKTHKGRKNYTTKKGDKVFHRKGKYVRKSRKPYSKKKRGGQAVAEEVGSSSNLKYFAHCTGFGCGGT